jgi:alkylhydroperoxidase family enzyme
MPPITLVYKPSDYPGEPDDATKAELADLFGQMFPGKVDPEIDRSHAGMAILAQNPKLALLVSKLAGYIAVDMPWCHRRDLRELLIQTVNLHFKSDYSFQVRLAPAAAAGISLELQAAIPYWKTTALFNDEQRLVIEYVNAVVTGDPPAELVARVVERFGEKGAVEFTTAVAWWSFWAMIINAARPTFEREA